MHDFHLADQIYKTIIDYAQRHQLKKVIKAIIELGSIIEHGEEILPENLKFNVKMLSQGGPAEDIELVISRVQGNQWVLREIVGE